MRYLPILLLLLTSCMPTHIVDFHVYQCYIGNKMTLRVVANDIDGAMQQTKEIRHKLLIEMGAKQFEYQEDFQIGCHEIHNQE